MCVCDHLSVSQLVEKQTIHMVVLCFALLWFWYQLLRDPCYQLMHIIFFLKAQDDDSCK